MRKAVVQRKGTVQLLRFPHPECLCTKGTIALVYSLLHGLFPTPSPADTKGGRVHLLQSSPRSNPEGRASLSPALFYLSLKFARFGNFSSLLTPPCRVYAREKRSLLFGNLPFSPMQHDKLDNYLRTFRKKLGLTQREVAFLLGCHGGAKVSHYERSGRVPNLKVIFAYEAIFQKPARELFAGIYERAERETLRRVRLLVGRLRKRQKSPLLARKIASLQAVVEGGPGELRYEPFTNQ